LPAYFSNCPEEILIKLAIVHKISSLAETLCNATGSSFYSTGKKGLAPESQPINLHKTLDNS